MTSEGMQTVRVRRGDERLAETLRHAGGTAVRVERALVKVAELNPIKTIYLGQKA